MCQTWLTVRSTPEQAQPRVQVSEFTHITTVPNATAHRDPCALRWRTLQTKTGCRHRRPCWLGATSMPRQPSQLQPGRALQIGGRIARALAALEPLLLRIEEAGARELARGHRELQLRLLASGALWRHAEHLALGATLHQLVLLPGLRQAVLLEQRAQHGRALRGQRRLRRLDCGLLLRAEHRNLLGRRLGDICLGITLALLAGRLLGRRFRGRCRRGRRRRHSTFATASAEELTDRVLVLCLQLSEA
mmetsp:Transcript_155449/g.497050  ORF Transcript_155449/g.497050 Transcript_155449/m.497050 type:complete len:248 (+) Transcript_155449:176-919(+)